MGGSINLQGGGQYQTPSVGASGRPPIDYGPRFRNLPEVRDRGYDQYGNYGGDYGNYGRNYGNVSTGGKGFQQQQPQYQPAPVMQPYVDQVSTGGKGFQGRPTPAQATAYAPMNIPQMQLAQPAFYYPNIGSQMANLQATSGLGGLGALGAFGNYPMMPRAPMHFNMYPALQPPQAPALSVPTGGKGFRPAPPAYQPPTFQPPSRPFPPAFQPPSQPSLPFDRLPQPLPQPYPAYRPPSINPELTPVMPTMPDARAFPQTIEPYPYEEPMDYAPEYRPDAQPVFEQLAPEAPPADAYVPPEEPAYFPERNDRDIQLID